MTARLEPALAPSEHDKQIASRASELLEPFLKLPHEVRVQLMDEPTPENILSLPAPALRLLHAILTEMAQGNAVTLLPIPATLTTQAAANILNVSRPFLIGLLEQGKIPYQRLGSHRRILLQDLRAFQEKTTAARDEALRELTTEAQELEMGY